MTALVPCPPACSCPPGAHGVHPFTRADVVARLADLEREIARLENEVNARDLVIERLRLDVEEAHIARIAAQNPGIDLESVRRRRRKDQFLASLPDVLDVQLDEDPPDRTALRVVGRFTGPDGQAGIVSEVANGEQVWGVVDA